jgi:hypothetical protein
VRFALFLMVVACGHNSDVGSGSSSTPPAPPASPVVAAKPAPPPPIDATPPPPIDAAPPPIDAPASAFRTQLCIDVVTKIEACAADPTFIAALDAGASPAQKRANAKFRKDYATKIAAIPDPSDRCDAGERFNFQHEGFFEHWDVLAGSDALASCASLGAAIAKADGFPGGQVAD